MNIAIVLYDGVTALDFVGPSDILSRWPGAKIHFVASSDEPLRTDSGLPIRRTHDLDDLETPDLLLVPGSTRPLAPLADERLKAWVRVAASSASWTTSVCTGAGVLAAAGVLDGKRATTHWAFRDALAAMGAEVVPERIVIDGHIATAAGVSAGIDLALALTARVHGDDLAQVLQLAIEYDPQPPFDAGNPESAGERILALAHERLVEAASA